MQMLHIPLKLLIIPQQQVFYCNQKLRNCGTFIREYFRLLPVLSTLKICHSALDHLGPNQDCKCRSSQWTLDSKRPFLEEHWRWYLGGEL